MNCERRETFNTFDFKAISDNTNINKIKSRLRAYALLIILLLHLTLLSHVAIKSSSVKLITAPLGSSNNVTLQLPGEGQEPHLTSASGACPTHGIAPNYLNISRFSSFHNLRIILTKLCYIFSVIF